MQMTTQIDRCHDLWPKIRRNAYWILFFLAWSGGIFLLDSIVSKAPLNQPISLDPPGIVDTSIWIPLPERYFLEFEFSRTGHSFEQMKQMIGDWWPSETDGIPVPITWSLTSRKTNSIVASGTTVSKGASGWSHAAAYRHVDTIRVQPGRYQFRVRILNAVPELATTPTRVSLSSNFKTVNSWQSNALFLCVLFTLLLILPLTVVLLVLLIGRVGSHYWRLRNETSPSNH
jgi:hypothetical protein